MKRNTDRRKRRTRKLLQSSILQLVLEKKYEQIMIEDITENVNLGRTTFYLHYKDKDELLYESLAKMWDDLFHTIYSDENPQKWRDEDIDPRRIVFEHAAENAKLYRSLFRGEFGGIVFGHFRKRLTEIFVKVTENWQNVLELAPKVPNTVTTNYITGAFIGLLSWWLESEMPYPPDEIFDLYNQITVRGVSWAIGHSPGPQENLI
jgi:AcrR family transcriptional regulator